MSPYPPALSARDREAGLLENTDEDVDGSFDRQATSFRFHGFAPWASGPNS